MRADVRDQVLGDAFTSPSTARRAAPSRRTRARRASPRSARRAASGWASDISARCTCPSTPSSRAVSASSSASSSRSWSWSIMQRSDASIGIMRSWRVPRASSIARVTGTSASCERFTSSALLAIPASPNSPSARASPERAPSTASSTLASFVSHPSSSTGHGMYPGSRGSARGTPDAARPARGHSTGTMATRSRIRWHLTAADTEGRLLRGELWVPPGAPARPLHRTRGRSGSSCSAARWSSTSAGSATCCAAATRPS